MHNCCNQEFGDGAHCSSSEGALLVHPRFLQPEEEPGVPGLAQGPDEGLMALGALPHAHQAPPLLVTHPRQAAVLRSEPLRHLGGGADAAPLHHVRLEELVLQHVDVHVGSAGRRAGSEVRPELFAQLLQAAFEHQLLHRGRRPGLVHVADGLRLVDLVKHLGGRRGGLGEHLHDHTRLPPEPPALAHQRQAPQPVLPVHHRQALAVAAAAAAAAAGAVVKQRDDSGQVEARLLLLEGGDGLSPLRAEGPLLVPHRHLASRELLRA
eukprot:CAMPEP_0119119582 /NCGR_PEP_ID=MMETSP1310-20130426/1011_1 /TAXON_ID=464262 /ORGANISM="Genus nov. species nov., Strain RCC2339" /LENGTH=265 /DNA_ID=CAMNT_0007109027 /DNA_START=19 /DNA_END=812 /DNA_ORIENTATION=+